jgi:hypothetical protein
MKKLHYFALWCAAALFSHALQAQTNYNKLISLPPMYYEESAGILIEHTLPTFNSGNDPALGYIGQPAQVSHNIQHD